MALLKRRKKNDFHSKSSTSCDEKSANSSNANISHSRQEGQLISSAAANRRLRECCNRVALIEFPDQNDQHINTEQVNLYGLSVTVTINMMYWCNTARMQQKQTPDLRLLLLDLTKKPKKIP